MTLKIYSSRYVFPIIILLTNVIPAFSMQKLLWQITQTTTAGILVSSGIQKASQYNEQIKQPVDGKPMPDRVQHWIINEMNKLNVPNASTIPLLETSNFKTSWAVTNGKAIVCLPEKAMELDQALSRIHNNSTRDNSIIALAAIILKHEIKHYLQKDHKKQIYALALAPIIIQASCSAVTHNFNKFFNITPPKQWSSTLMRSALSVGSMPLKIALAGSLIALHNQYLEREADRFACKNAANQLELQEFHQYLKNSENIYWNPPYNPMVMRLLYIYYQSSHPYPPDRTKDAEWHLKEWNKKHNH